MPDSNDWTVDIRPVGPNEYSAPCNIAFAIITQFLRDGTVLFQVSVRSHSNPDDAWSFLIQVPDWMLLKPEATVLDQLLLISTHFAVALIDLATRQLLWVHDPGGYIIHKAWFNARGIIILCEELTILAKDLTGARLWSHEGPDVVQFFSIEAGKLRVMWFNGAETMIDERTGEVI